MLIVTNGGATALAAGGSLKLFNAAICSGLFAMLKLPPLPAGLGWNPNYLNLGGTLSVVVIAKPFFLRAARLAARNLQFQSRLEIHPRGCDERGANRF
jgi:hypothetical protein